MFQLPFSKYVDYKSSHEIKELKYGPALLSAVSIWTMSAFLNICNHILSTTKLVLWEMANTKSKRFLYSYNTKTFFCYKSILCIIIFYLQRMPIHSYIIHIYMYYIGETISLSYITYSIIANEYRKYANE